jgi:putative spermidine/putrescine transport system substrate-binding protein
MLKGSNFITVALAYLPLATPSILRATEPDQTGRVDHFSTWGGNLGLQRLKGVSDPFHSAQAFAFRHDLTEDNGNSAKSLGSCCTKPPPPSIGWDTTTNAASVSLTRVCGRRSVPSLPNLAGVTDATKPDIGVDGFDQINTWHVYVLAYRWPHFPWSHEILQRLCLIEIQKVAWHFTTMIGGFPAQIARVVALDGIPGDIQPTWDFIAEMKEQDPLLGERS